MISPLFVLIGKTYTLTEIESIILSSDNWKQEFLKLEKELTELHEKHENNINDTMIWQQKYYLSEEERCKVAKELKELKNSGTSVWKEGYKDGLADARLLIQQHLDKQ